jgi:phospholipid/cholesterol/gamma-HCH transport system ATP-binding protein
MTLHAGPPLIRFEGVAKAFGRNVIFSDLTIDVFNGENLVIMGGSGTGKSVMLKCLIGLLTPESGSIWYRDEEITAMTEVEQIQVRRHIAYVFQQAALFDSMTVYENIAYPLRAHLKLTEDEIGERVALNLARVGMPDTEQLMPAQLSGGMRKRIGLARAIALEPEVILWDEPTTGLDPSNTRRIAELILKMQAELKCTSLVVTHDMTAAMLVADRVALVYDRKIASVLPKERLAAEPPGSLIKSFVEGTLDL